ncbi:MAG: carboxylesterase family protein [Christensenellaceae bacterium]|nr:carboxylesterase family protein [Christensenellaceae bacterium]
MPFTGVDYDLSVAMASYFANFVKTGNPNSPELPKWTAFTEENRKCLELCEDIKMIDIE